MLNGSEVVRIPPKEDTPAFPKPDNVGKSMEVPAISAPPAQQVSTASKENEITIADKTERSTTNPVTNEPASVSANKTSKTMPRNISPKKTSSETYNPETEAVNKDKPEVISVVMKAAASKPISSQSKAALEDPKDSPNQIKVAQKDPKDTPSQGKTALEDPKATPSQGKAAQDPKATPLSKTAREVTNATSSQSKTGPEDPKSTSQSKTAQKDPKPTSKSKSANEDPKPASRTKPTSQNQPAKGDPKSKSPKKASSSLTKSKEVSTPLTKDVPVAPTIGPEVTALKEVVESIPKDVVASAVSSVSNKENVTPPSIEVEKSKQPKSTPTPQTLSPTKKKSDVNVPIVNLPIVTPIEKGTTLRMMRNRPRIPRNTQRSANTSNSVQNVLQQMVGGPQRSGVPCGRCDCCRSLLTYVTVLRNFMDHIVSGMAQGTSLEEEAANLPPMPCTLCEVQHVEHIDHTPKSTGLPKDTPVMERPVTQQQVQGESQKQTSHDSAPDKSTDNQPQRKSSYAPGHNHQFPHHNQSGWQPEGQSSSPQGQSASSYQGQITQGQSWTQPRQQPSRSQNFNQTNQTQFSQGQNVNQQNITPLPQGQTWNQQSQMQASSQGQTWNQQSQSGTPQGQTSNQQSQSQASSQGQTSNQQSQVQASSQGQTWNQQNQSQTTSQGQTWSQQPNQSNAPPSSPHGQSSQYQQFGDSAANTQGPVPDTTTSGQSVNTWSTFTDPNAPKSTRRPRRMENVAWGATQRQQSREDNLTSETPITEMNQYATGSPTKGHFEQYDEDYAEDDYEDEDYEIETNHAYVTLATDNETALLCMILGNSLLLSGTTKTLVVLVTEDVSPHMRYLLSTIYNNVENVDMMQSPGTTSLALLEQPDLGVSFTKLLIWGIENFDKGVFLDPNTLVVQNCDELFDRDELSAVPDIGWPDCFNSDVFVYKPSMDTFWSLLGCAEAQDSFDGGDQGLLNMYFRDWSRNISKKLPFLYNLMANVSYTYKPAFKQFGSQVKIVNFFGSYKPHNVQFHSATGQMAPDSNVHPTYAQFVYYWLEIFTKRVLPLFSQEIHDFVDNQEYASAMDVLKKFFPSNSRKRKESLPTPPSFRVYADANLDRPRRRSAVQINREELEVNEEVGLASHDQVPVGNASEEAEQTAETVEEIPAVPQTMPGSEVGNYQDMAAWEHGRMDYLGTHSSDNIMARLSYFMNKPPEPQT